MVLAHNLLAMNAQRQFNITGINQKKSTEKLSSGYRINRAADDAAGLQISEKMRRQINGLNRGTENMEDGVSWLQIGDGAMAEVQAILQRMTELSVHGANGTLSESDRQAIDAEMQQLKVELNRINETTKFNEQRIFADDHQVPSDIGTAVIKKLNGVPDDLSIFNASYDKTTGKATYGGIIFKGERISWDKIEGQNGIQMVDKTTQKFHEGTWVYMPQDSNHMFTISAKEGDEVPRITRHFDVTADENGLIIDGETVAWKDIRNQSGQSVADTDYFNGTWTADYHGASLTFEVKNSFLGLNGMIDAINEGHDENRYHVYAEYAGSSDVKAVDADIAITGLNLSENIAKTIADGGKYIIHASREKGIWLSTDKDSTPITGSEKKWDQLGIDSWEEGKYIRPDKQYQYSYTEGNGVTKIEFTFSLADVTSVDSVVDGLNGVELNEKNIKSHYKTDPEPPTDKHVKDITLSGTPILSVKNEVDLGRNFEQKTQDKFVNGTLSSPPTGTPTDSVTLSFQDVITYTGQTTDIQTQMKKDLEAFEQSVISNKILQTLAGVSPDIDLSPKDLQDLLGSGKVTSRGELSEQILINDSITPSTANGWVSSYQLQKGKTYSCAHIDFSGLSSAEDVWELVGSGFNSTCATCDKHYSFKFVFDITEESEPDVGIRYRADKSDSNNPVLEISVSSLIEKNKTTGKDIAESLLNIADAVFDDHYQQYAIDDKGTFYIVEPRPESQWWRKPEFYTVPHDALNQKSYDLNLISKDNGNGTQKLTYTYDFADYQDQIKVEMIPDNTNGAYVEKDGGGFEEYVPEKHSGKPRFNIQVTYSNADTIGTSNSTLSESKTLPDTTITYDSLGYPDSARKTYAKQAIDKMIDNTKISLSATDYTTADISGDEHDNKAVDSLFEAYSVELSPLARNGFVKGADSIQIQKSGDVPNRLIIPRFSLNTSVLGLTRANCLTAGDSRNAIDMVNRALANVSARRSLYGALQNRLEHSINSNENTAENTTAAESRIRDTDMAEETVNHAKNNILAQAGQSMLAQANLSQQSVLSLLQ